MIRSLIEGVTYSQKDCLDLVEALGVAVTSVRASGGGARSPFWRVVQLVGGVALFLYALRLLAPMPGDRVGFILLVALLAAGSMALTDSIVGVLAAMLDKTQKKDPE